MLSPIDSFPFVFTLVFITALIIIVLTAIVNFYRSLRRPAQSSTEPAAIVKEREIIREIVKIRCPYCNNLYDETQDKCPHCGGKRTP